MPPLCSTFSVNMPRCLPRSTRAPRLSCNSIPKPSLVCDFGQGECRVVGDLAARLRPDAGHGLFEHVAQIAEAITARILMMRSIEMTVRSAVNAIG